MQPVNGSASLADLAYERIEALIANCELAPGLHLTMQALQDRLGFGRTPVHQAIKRMQADTLIHIMPRQGLQVAPIDLARERVLLDLRADVERIVVRLATERANIAQRTQLQQLQRQLEELGSHITVPQFNEVDRKIDSLLLRCAGEPFLTSTLRPLHTFFRRLGGVYHTKAPSADRLTRSVAVHIDVLKAVASGEVKAAVTASDALMSFVESMFSLLAHEVPPSMLNAASPDAH